MRRELGCWEGGGALRGLALSRRSARTQVSPPLSRTAALGVSFGLVACVLGLVLALCFADEFLVSGDAPTGAGAVAVRAPSPGDPPC